MYKLDFSDNGRTTLSLLDKEVGQRVLDKLRWLVQNIENIPLPPLHGKYAGFFKLKTGSQYCSKRAVKKFEGDYGK